MSLLASLSALRVFEAAARNGGFRAAAVELHLSPSAVSHAIRQLEGNLGVRLFERKARRVILTPDGAALLRHLSVAFEEIRRGLVAVSSRGSSLLRIHCAPSFAAQWLSPRLKDFVAEHSGVELRLAANAGYATFPSEEFEADIVYGAPRAEGLVAHPLVEEVLTPLCSPSLAARIQCPRDLLDLPLIQSDQKQLRWPDWLRANEIAAAPFPIARFDRSFLAIAAAGDSLGIALESTLLAEREIRQGRLVAPLAGKAADLQYVGHHLVYPQTLRSRRPLRQFVSWLFRELELPPPALA